MASMVCCRLPVHLSGDGELVGRECWWSAADAASGSDDGEAGHGSVADEGAFELRSEPHRLPVAGLCIVRAVSLPALRRCVVLVLLGLGVASPFLYFGAQLVCGLRTAGYSFMREAASDLGTSDRPYHRAFNAAAIATGCSLVCGGIGLLLVRPMSRRVATIIVAVCCLSAGAAAVSAGLYPLPDSRHGGGPIGAGLFVAPFAIAFALGDRARMRPYLGLNIAMFVAGGAILSGGNPAIAGVGQRLLAAAVFPPLALVFGLRLRAVSRKTPTLATDGTP